MRFSIDPTEMTRLDRVATERYGIPSVLLMENAGSGAFREIRDHLSPTPETVFFCICGKGNNGGDGFVIARHAHNEGYPVVVAILGDRTAIASDSDPGVNLAILERMGIETHEIRAREDLEALGARASDTAILVDAVLGTGLRGEVRGIAREAIEWINATPGRVAAIDIPSGLDGSTGEVLGESVSAEITVTFALPKTGLLEGRGPEKTGELVVVPISIPREELQACRAGKSSG